MWTMVPVHTPSALLAPKKKKIQYVSPPGSPSRTLLMDPAQLFRRGWGSCGDQRPAPAGTSPWPGTSRLPRCAYTEKETSIRDFFSSGKKPSISYSSITTFLFLFVYCTFYIIRAIYTSYISPCYYSILVDNVLEQAFCCQKENIILVTNYMTNFKHLLKCSWCYCIYSSVPEWTQLTPWWFTITLSWLELASC